jgi:dTDP-4-dehydrorhamnose reductase
MAEAVMAVNTFITGATGKLGRQLVEVFPDALAPARKELDITDKEAVFNFVTRNKPTIVIHCAALTGIRQCEEDKETAWRVNVGGTENLVDACEESTKNCYFAYVSTACVFCGDKGNYVETDTPYPKNFYSLTKLLGESTVKYSNLKKWLIIRTNFVAREKWPYPKAFADRWGTYLFADDLAKAIKTVIGSNITGVLHICGKDKLSMLELARITTPEVEPMYMSQYNGPPLTVDMSLKSIRMKPFEITRNASA